MTCWIALVACAFVVGGCVRTVTAAEVCGQLDAAGVAANCRAERPNGIGAAAAEKQVFDLRSSPGATGQVLRFESVQAYDRAAFTFDDVGVFNNTFRRGFPERRILVQMHESVSLDDARRARAVIDDL